MPSADTKIRILVSAEQAKVLPGILKLNCLMQNYFMKQFIGFAWVKQSFLISKLLIAASAIVPIPILISAEVAMAFHVAFKYLINIKRYKQVARNDFAILK